MTIKDLKYIERLIQEDIRKHIKKIRNMIKRQL